MECSGTAHRSPVKRKVRRYPESLAEAALSPQVGDVLSVAEVFDIVDDLLQTGRNGEAASVGHIAGRTRRSSRSGRHTSV